MGFPDTLQLSEQIVWRQHCTYLPCRSFDELSEDQLPQIICHSPTACCRLLGTWVFRPLPAHTTLGLLFLAHFAEEIASKKPTASSNAASVPLSELQAAALNPPFRASLSQMTSQAVVDAFISLAPYPSYSSKHPHPQPFTSGFTFLRHYVPITKSRGTITPGDSLQRVKRNSHLRGGKSILPCSANTLKLSFCSAQPASSLSHTPGNSLLISGHSFMPDLGQRSTCRPERVAQQLPKLLALLIKPNSEMETNRERFSYLPSLPRWFPSNIQPNMHKYYSRLTSRQFKNALALWEPHCRLLSESTLLPLTK